MKAKLFIIAFVLVSAVSLVNAAIVFDNGQPTVFSDFGNDALGWLQADDFVLSQDTSLTGVHFWAIEVDIIPWDGTVEYYIFDDNNNSPGAVVASGNGQSIQKVDTGIHTPTATEYEYSFDLEDSADLSSNNTYWLGLHLAADYPVDDSYWNWWSPSVTAMGLGGYESVNGSMDNWVGTNIDRAFYLEGVPEPATFLLLGIGLVFTRSKK